MNIGFFADDSSAIHAALLANTAFNHRSPERLDVLAGSNRIADTVPIFLEAARIGKRHLMVALPLAQLENTSVRRRLDLAVVTADAHPDALAAARRAMANDAERADRLAPPVWLLDATLPRATQENVAHTLPVTFTKLQSREAANLRSGCPCGPLHQRAIGLAAALRIAVDDPYADAIDPTEIAELLMSGTSNGQQTPETALLREILLDLADDLSEGPPHLVAQAKARRTITDPKRRVMRPGPRPPTARAAARPASAIQKAKHVCSAKN